MMILVNDVGGTDSPTPLGNGTAWSKKPTNVQRRLECRGGMLGVWNC